MFDPASARTPFPAAPRWFAPGPVTECYCATDKNLLCIHVLSSLSDISTSQRLVPHVFGDIDERLDPSFLEDLNKLTPPDTASKEAIEEYVILMQDVILERQRAGTLFRENLTAPCKTCQQEFHIFIIVLRETQT